MWCPDCETIDEYFFDTTFFWCFLPTTESVSKLTAFCEKAGYTANLASTNCLTIEVTQEKVSKFLTQLNGCLDGPEFGNTKITTTSTDTQPDLRAMGRMTTAEILTRRFQAKWLVTAIETNRYESWFQPIVYTSNDTDNNCIFAFEALFRVYDEYQAMIPPAFAFSLAEQSNLLFALDLAARRSAVEHFNRARLPGKLFINFNPSSIYDPAYCLRATAATINQLGMQPSDVVFEIIETHKANDINHLKGILSFYRNAGFGVALDDIGSGWSGLNLLDSLRPDYVKIDQALIKHIDSDSYKQTIVKHLIQIAKQNGINVIAEGIETQQEATMLSSYGADYLQGYYFAKPKRYPDAVDKSEIQKISDSVSRIKFDPSDNAK